MRPYAVRSQRGRLHIAVQDGRAYVAACHRVLRGRDLVVYEARQADLAWKWETRCLDCEHLAGRGPQALRKVAGW